MNYIKLLDSYFDNKCYGIIVTDIDVDIFQDKINELKKDVGDDVEAILENIPNEWNWNIINDDLELYI